MRVREHVTSCGVVVVVGRRRGWAWRWLGRPGMAVACAGGFLAASSAVADAAWKPVVPPRIGHAYSLRDVAATSRFDVWAVGSFIDRSSREQALILRRGRSGWRDAGAVHSHFVGSRLTSVVALSGRNVWAAGFTNAHTQPMFWGTPLFEHWDGSRWTIVPSPRLGVAVRGVELNGLCRVPGRRRLWAVGTKIDQSGIPNGGLIEHWNGRRWAIVPAPGFAVVTALNACAAISPNDISIVGQSGVVVGGTGLVLRWNGNTWQATTNLPGVTVLDGITATRAGRLWVVGEDDSLGPGKAAAFDWTHAAGWTAVSPNFADPMAEYDVAARRGEAWMVGGTPGQDMGGAPGSPTVARWTHTRGSWREALNTTLPGVLFGVAQVPGTTRLWAVGERFPIAAPFAPSPLIMKGGS
jgi:hypothetical protein